MAAGMDGSAPDRKRYRVSELPPHHFAALDDDAIGAMASRAALSEVSWTPDVAAAVTDRLARDVVAYPEHFAPGLRVPSAQGGKGAGMNVPANKRPRATRRSREGMALAMAGLVLAGGVVGVSVFLGDPGAGVPGGPGAGDPAQPRALTAVTEDADRPDAGSAIAIDQGETEIDDRSRSTSPALTIVAARFLRDEGVGARVRLEGSLPSVAGQVHRTQLQRKLRGGPWKALVSTDGGGSLETTLVPGIRYNLRVRSFDEAGNLLSTRRLRAVLTIRHWDSELIERTPGDWTTTTGDPKLGGALASKTTEAAITTSFKGAGVALVAPIGPEEGAMRIRVDGGEWVIGDLGDVVPAERAIVFGRDLENGEHSLDIAVEHGVITLDSMLFVRTPPAWAPRS